MYMNDILLVVMALNTYKIHLKASKHNTCMIQIQVKVLGRL